VLGVIEDAAIRYNSGAIDKDWMERLLGPAFVAMFDRSLWFLTFFREHEKWPSMNAELESMVRELRQSRHASLRSVHLLSNIRTFRQRYRQRKQGTYAEITACRPQKVRVICLPPDPDAATNEAWSRACHLSAALATDHRAIHGFGSPPRQTRPHDNETARWTAIVVPQSIDDIEENRKFDDDLSRKLNGYLASLADADDESGFPVADAG
jgi:hypothetical protein